MKKDSNDKKLRKSDGIFLLLFFLFSVVSIVLGCICIGGIKGITQQNRLVFSVLFSLIVLIVCTFSVWAVFQQKVALVKTIFSGDLFLLLCLGLALILQKTGFFEVIQSAESLQAYLANAGGWMPAVYILLQFLQVVILPIPSVVSTVAGVALFGAWKAAVYSSIGILSGSIFAFFIGRKIGNRAVAWMIGEEVLLKWQKKLKGKDNLVLTLMFVLPLFPDDVLCFLAGLSSMTTIYFLVMILIARVLGICATCFSVDLIPFNTWWGISLWGAFFLLLIISFVYLYKNMEKIQKKWSKYVCNIKKKRK